MLSALYRIARQVLPQAPRALVQVLPRESIAFRALSATTLTALSLQWARLIAGCGDEGKGIGPKPGPEDAGVDGRTKDAGLDDNLPPFTDVDESEPVETSEGSEGSEGVEGSEGSEGTEGSEGVEGSEGSEGTEGSEGLEGSEGAEADGGISDDAGLVDADAGAGDGGTGNKIPYKIGFGYIPPQSTDLWGATAKTENPWKSLLDCDTSVAPATFRFSTVLKNSKVISLEEEGSFQATVKNCQNNEDQIEIGIDDFPLPGLENPLTDVVLKLTAKAGKSDVYDVIVCSGATCFETEGEIPVIASDDFRIKATLETTQE